MSLRKDEEKNQITKKKTMEELLQENKALKEKNLKLEVELLYLKKIGYLNSGKKTARKGNFLDDCLMENFYGKMKNEMFYGHEYEFTSLDELQKSMEEYIDYYNNERIQTKLKA